MKAYILLAEGFETVEALGPADVFKRAGVEYKLVSISSDQNVTSSHGVRVQADCCLGDGSQVEDGDVLVLPGGYPGYVNLRSNEEVCRLAWNYYESGRLLAAICGAPTLLQQEGLAVGARITCHHSVKDDMKNFVYTGKIVERDGNLITAIGAGRSFDFALAIVEALLGNGAVDKIKGGLELR